MKTTGLNKAQKAFDFFKEISKIPRVSGNMEKISQYLYHFGKSLGLKTYRDTYGNVTILKAASGFPSGKNSVMIQAHMDMVGEKYPNIQHDFFKDPVSLIVTEDTVCAKGTTLGGDNGVGISYLMALLDSKNTVHPDIEAVFTVNEETDMSGALNYDMSKIRSKIIISLDAQAITLSACGEIEYNAILPIIQQDANADNPIIGIDIFGLEGGHSGKDAVQQRGNAIVLLGKILMDLAKQGNEYRIIDIKTDNCFSSSIPRNASVLISIPKTRKARFFLDFKTIYPQLLNKYSPKNPHMKITAREISNIQLKKCQIWNSETTYKVVHLLNHLPEGVYSYEPDHPHIMTSCCNIGCIGRKGGNIFITSLIRGNSSDKKNKLFNIAKQCCALNNADCIITRDIPHWEQSADKQLKEAILQIYNEPMIMMQATAECGCFLQGSQKRSAVGLAAPVYNIHTPKEYFLLSEYETYWNRLTAFLQSTYWGEKTYDRY